MVIFRENTEDLYRGIEWKGGTAEAKTVIDFLRNVMGVEVDPDSGIGIKPMSSAGTKRFVRWAIDWTVKAGRRGITIVHKGNIMKYTEGAFREWAYETAREFDDLSAEGTAGKIPINDRIADNMFMQVIARPGDYDVLLCPNLNGDYLSDACAALIGGLGVAPGRTSVTMWRYSSPLTGALRSMRVGTCQPHVLHSLGGDAFRPYRHG
jgi:isocitrate dehydrogenase